MLIDIELKAFGESIGLQNLQLNENGCLKFILEQNRTVQVEKADDEVFFFILKTFELAPLPYETYEKALALPLQHAHAPFALQAVAKTDHDIGFFTRLRENECDQPTIYKLFKYLILCCEYVENPN